jgi:hypothetical protein
VSHEQRLVPATPQVQAGPWEHERPKGLVGIHFHDSWRDEALVRKLLEEACLEWGLERPTNLTTLEAPPQVTAKTVLCCLFSAVRADQASFPSSGCQAGVEGGSSCDLRGLAPICVVRCRGAWRCMWRTTTTIAPWRRWRWSPRPTARRVRSCLNSDGSNHRAACPLK